MRGQQGQAYLEVLVATVLLTLAITPFLIVYLQTTRGTVQSSDREGAIDVVQGVVEQVLTGASPATPQTNGIYTVTWTKVAVNGRSGLNRVTVTASWLDRDAVQSYALTTYSRR